MIDNFRNVLFGILTVFGLVMPLVEDASAQTRLGLHVTQEELNVWKQRAQTGPYKSAGDVQTNSPGDWTRIQANADLSYSAQRWTGQPAGSCWSWRSNPPALPNRDWGERVRDGAFVYLVTGNTTYRDNVLTELLAQAALAGVNWTDTTRWNTGSTCLSGDAHSWTISMWLTKLLLAYDYIRHSISEGNRATLDTWFTNAATLFNSNVHLLVQTVWPNRDSDNYTTWGPGYPTCITPALTHFGGFTHCQFHEIWNNRSANHVRFFSLVGIMTGNTTLKNRGKRWFNEWVRFANFGDSTNSQFHRSKTDGHPGIGWNYVALMIGAMTTVADAFARAGDTTLYEFSTSLGEPSGTLTPAGGPKSLLSVTKKWLDYLDGTVQRYTQSGSDPTFKIDSVDEAFGQAWISDAYIVPGNLYWRDARLTSIYRRTATGAPAYPANPSSFGACVYCGDWATLPGVFFMFGQMEGKVWPYSTGTPATTSPPAAPSGLTTSNK